MTVAVKPKVGPIEGKPIRSGGGVYVYRTRKSGSVLGIYFRGLPWYVWPLVTMGSCILNQVVNGAWWIGLAILLFTGRHFAYVGETVSFKDRHREHIIGGGRWAKKCQPWSDLDPRCVLRLPLPPWKWLLHAIETFGILVCAPVYNDRKNKWNPRRIPLRSARRQRVKRDGRKLKITFNFRAIHLVQIVVGVIALHVLGVF
jgi:hypothetical protein